MKILLTADGTTTGGVKVFIENLYKQLAKNNRIIFLVKNDGDYKEYLLENKREVLSYYSDFSSKSVKLLNYNIPNLMGLLNKRRTVKKTRDFINNIVKSIKPDSILYHNVQPIIMYGCILKKYGVFSVFCQHSIPNSNDLFSLRKRIAAYYINKYCNKIIGVSSLVLSFYGKLIKIKKNVIHHTTDLTYKDSNKREIFRKEHDIRSEKFIIGTMSRVCNQRGIHLFIETAIDFLKQTNDENVVFMIAGNYYNGDKYIQRINSMIKGSGFEERIVYVGKQDPLLYLSGIDVFCQTLIIGIESFGLSILEALFAGVPSIITDKNGIDEILPSELCLRYNAISKIELLNAFDKSRDQIWRDKQISLAKSFRQSYLTFGDWGKKWELELKSNYNT